MSMQSQSAQGAQKNDTLAYICGGVAVVIWSTLPTAFKLAFQYIEPIQLLLIATIVSLLFLLAMLTWQKRLGEFRTLKRNDILLCAGLGFVNPFFYYLILFAAYDALPAQVVQPINATWAIMLALLSVPILGHSMKRLEWIAIGISYMGGVVIASRGDPSSLMDANWVGLGLAFASTILWSFYWIGSARSRLEPVLGLTLCFLLGLPWVVIGNALILGWSGFYMPWEALPYGIYVGLFEMGLTFVLWLYALRLTTCVGRISNLIFFAPFLSLFLVNIFLGEEILVSTIGGLCCIVVGNALQQYAARKDT